MRIHRRRVRLAEETKATVRLSHDVDSLIIVSGNDLWRAVRRPIIDDDHEPITTSLGKSTINAVPDESSVVIGWRDYERRQRRSILGWRLHIGELKSIPHEPICGAV